MKKNLMILTMALMIAQPVFGLAADAATPAAPEVQAAETTPVTPIGGQYGRRWNQTNPDETVPQAGFVDADGDGVCDACGNAQGTDPSSPNYIDENKDGVCDHFGTDEQGQGQGRMQEMRGRMQKMMGRMQEMRGRMQQTMGRGQNAQGRGQGMMGLGVQGNTQGSNYLDANNDGVCDHYNGNTQRNFGHGRNRR
ncbi:MAG: DUF4175 domain-containing protein [Clostridiales bacterium]|nr:DUF4175 domain-containing protein [Clostridiales bacterium]